MQLLFYVKLTKKDFTLLYSHSHKIFVKLTEKHQRLHLVFQSIWRKIVQRFLSHPSMGWWCKAFCPIGKKTFAHYLIWLKNCISIWCTTVLNKLLRRNFLCNINFFFKLMPSKAFFPHGIKSFAKYLCNISWEKSFAQLFFRQIDGIFH